MKRARLLYVIFGFFFMFAGCQKPVSDADAIRSGINAHLSGLKTINMSAMDMTVNSFSINGNQAQASVEFRPKTGAPQGAGMQVNYNLAKQNGVWVVQQTTPAGGMIQHPAPGENPASGMTSGAPAGSLGQLPNFNNLVGGASSGAALPAGHPAVNPQGDASATPPAYNPH